MSDASTKCPNPQCGCPVRAGDSFCPFCGQALIAAAANPAAETAPTPPLASEPPDVEAGPELAAFTSERPVGGQDPAAGGASAANDCLDLEVRYNNSCVFVLNMQSTFDFEIRPATDGIRDLYVEVRQSGQVIARETPMVIPKRGVTLPLGLNYIPLHTHAGKVSFTVVVGYRKDGRLRVYAAYRSHTIYSGKEDPRQVCESLVVEVKNNIQQGHAGDLQVDQSFDSLREALRQRNTIALDREFLQLINTRPFWTVLPLAACTEDAPGGASPLSRARHPQRLVLRSADGTGIHLLTQTPVRIGRAKDCEIVARAFDSAGKQLIEESLRIGRYHACLEWKGSQCQILDRGYYAREKRWRPSATGVWIDGQRLPSGQEFTFAPRREYRITLAGPVGDKPAEDLGVIAPGEPRITLADDAGDKAPGFALAARLWLARELPPPRPGCPELRATPDAPACLILRRIEGPPEAFVLLRLAARLAWADARCGAACVCRRENLLHFSDGHGCDWPVPGRSLRAGAVDFQVVEPKAT